MTEVFSGNIFRRESDEGSETLPWEDVVTVVARWLGAHFPTSGSPLQANAKYCFAGGLLIKILAARHFEHGAKWAQEGQERGQFRHGKSVHDFDDSRAGCRDGESREDRLC